MLQDNLSSSRSSRQDLNSNNEVALDIGSIAAAGEKCIDKVVMVSGKTLTFNTVERLQKCCQIQPLILLRVAVIDNFLVTFRQC